jgi:hypothetical protein
MNGVEIISIINSLPPPPTWGIKRSGLTNEVSSPGVRQIIQKSLPHNKFTYPPGVVVINNRNQENAFRYIG